MKCDAGLTIAGLADTTGSLEVTGGQLIVSNNVIGIGNDGTTLGGGGVGSMSIENAEVTATAVVLGSADGGQGSLSILPGAILKLRPSDNPEADTPCKLTLNAGLLDGGDD